MKNGNGTEHWIKAFASLNPVPATELPALEAAPQRDRTLAVIKARRNEPVGRTRLLPRRPRLAAIAAIALATALAVPAFAFSGQLSALFGFSNRGTSVDKSRLSLRTASALDRAGADRGIRLLASRSGVGIYVAHGKGERLCFFVGPPNGLDRRGLSGGCMRAAGSASFPSSAQPVIDMSAFFYKPGAVGEGISRLAGVTADGVAKMQIIGLSCQVIAEAPAIGNVYVRTDLPGTPTVAIVGLNHDGEQIYLNKLRFWDDSACAKSGR
jgi:hypothetical protein